MRKKISPSLISYCFPSLCLPQPNRLFCLLRNNRSESTPPKPFLSLRSHSGAMWSLPIVTAQRRPASGCEEQRDRRLTDQPTVGATHWLITFFIYYPFSLDIMRSLASAAHVFNGEVGLVKLNPSGDSEAGWTSYVGEKTQLCFLWA